MHTPEEVMPSSKGVGCLKAGQPKRLAGLKAATHGRRFHPCRQHLGPAAQSESRVFPFFRHTAKVCIGELSGGNAPIRLQPFRGSRVPLLGRIDIFQAKSMPGFDDELLTIIHVCLRRWLLRLRLGPRAHYSGILSLDRKTVVRLARCSSSR